LAKGAIVFYSWRNVGSRFFDLWITGTNLVVSVEIQIHSFSFTLQDNRRIIKWIIIGDSYVSVELERRGEGGNFQCLLFQLCDRENFDKQFVFIDKEFWLAVGYRLIFRNLVGEILDARELRLDEEVIKDFLLSLGFFNPFRSRSIVILRTSGFFQVRLRVYNILG